MALDAADLKSVRLAGSGAGHPWRRRQSQRPFDREAVCAMVGLHGAGLQQHRAAKPRQL